MPSNVQKVFKWGKSISLPLMHQFYKTSTFNTTCIRCGIFSLSKLKSIKKDNNWFASLYCETQ